MSLRHARITTALALLLVSLASAASAATLWDQSAISFSPNAPAIQNGKFTGFGGGNFFSVNDVTVPAGGWTVTTITEYFSDWEGVDMQAKAPNGVLILMPKTGAMPVGAPSTSTTVPLTWTDTVQSGQGVYVMVASGLNLVLAPGDYWITVSPICPIDNFFGNNAQWPALTTLGASVATYDTAWNSYYAGFDGAFKIEGFEGAATPTRNSSWGSLKALYR